MEFHSSDYNWYNNLYTYPGIAVNVIDGDTVEAHIDMGHKTNMAMTGENSIRLLGVDTPELDHSDDDHEDGAVEAKEFVENILDNHQNQFVLESVERGKFGRPLGILQVKNKNLSINKLLVKNGYYKKQASAVSESALPPNYINLNNSPKYQFNWLPGIGNSYAEKIIQNQPYSNTTDIIDVNGIGESTYKNIEKYITT